MFPRRVPQVLAGVLVVPGDTACESVPRVPQRTNRVPCGPEQRWLSAAA